MTDASPKRKQPSWLDLLPPAAPRPPRETLLTREELLAELHRRGVNVSEAALISWEKRGFAPRAIRSRREGRPVALYPEHAISAIAHLRELRETGRPLEEIAPIMRSWALSGLSLRDPLAKHQNAMRAPLLAFAHAVTEWLGSDVN